VTLPAVMDPRRPDLERSSTRNQCPLSGCPVTHHQTQTRLVNQLAGALRCNRRPRSRGRPSASDEHPRSPTRPTSTPAVQHQPQVVAVNVIGDYLQDQAYSFPAGQHRRKPLLRFGRVRRPLTRTRSSTTFGLKLGSSGGSRRRWDAAAAYAVFEQVAFGTAVLRGTSRRWESSP